MKYNIAIFDMDGTILDTLRDLTLATNHALKLNDFPTRTMDEIKNMVGNGIRKLVERAVPKGTDSETVEYVYRAFLPFYAEHCMDETKPYGEIVETIMALKNAGIYTAVVSNKKDNAVRMLVDKFFPECFDFALGERDGIKKKPAPDGVLMAIEALSKKRKEDDPERAKNIPDCAVYIGDSEVDALTADNSKIDRIIVTWGFRSRDALLNDGITGPFVDTPAQLRETLLLEFIKSPEFMKLGLAIERGNLKSAAMAVARLSKLAKGLGYDYIEKQLLNVKQCISSNKPKQALDIMAQITGRRVAIMNDRA